MYYHVLCVALLHLSSGNDYRLKKKKKKLTGFGFQVLSLSPSYTSVCFLSFFLVIKITQHAALCPQIIIFPL